MLVWIYKIFVFTPVISRREKEFYVTICESALDMSRLYIVGLPHQLLYKDSLFQTNRRSG